MLDADHIAETSGGNTPPYIAYKTWLTFLEDLKTHGIPDQIDRSVLKRFAWGIGGQLLVGIRALGLITADNKPTQRLADLVAALDTDQFKHVLERMLRESYPYVFKLDLTTATPTMFADAFKNNVGAKGEDVLAKCRRFFLQAAAAAGIEVGKRLVARGSGAAAAGGVKKKRAPRPKDDKAADTSTGTGSDANAGGAGGKTPSYMEALLAKFPPFDPIWPDDIKAKWFDGFDQFMKGAKS